MDLATLEGSLQSIEKKAADALTAQRAELDAARDEWKKHSEKLIQMGADAVEVKTTLERTLKRFDVIEAQMGTPLLNGKDRESKSIGHRFVEGDEFKSFKARAWHKGGVSLQLGNVFSDSPFELKTTIDSTALGSSTPGILIPERVGSVYYQGMRRTRVRDLIPRRPTSNNAIEWVKVNTFTNAASPQVEGSAKDEAALTFVIDSALVKTLAHWIPATRQALDDAAWLENAINTELLYGLALEEDEQLLLGDGTGQNLSGLITESTAYDTALNVAADTRIDKLSHALLQLELLHREASGIVLNPADWRAITLIKNDIGGANTGEYIMGSPASMAAPVLWGVPVALTTAMTSGKFLVGDFAFGATVFDRMQARIDISNEHSDFFVKNMVAIRAEERLALAVYRSDYFVYGSF